MEVEMAPSVEMDMDVREGGDGIDVGMKVEKALGVEFVRKKL